MKLYLEKIISGGQTGADRGGLEAGRELGLETGGTAPLGYRTERGRDNSLAYFGLLEHSNPAYPPRTMRNVDESDGTVAFRLMRSAGTDMTIAYARNGKWYYETPLSSDVGHRPVLVVREITDSTAGRIRNFVERNKVKVLNIAGHRESSRPGLCEEVKEVLVKALKEVE